MSRGRVDTLYRLPPLSPTTTLVEGDKLPHLTMNKWLRDQGPQPDQTTEALADWCVLRDTAAGVAVPEPLTVG